MEAHSDSITKGGRATSRDAEKGADLVIVSAYGRGNWLATELAGRGWNVTLTDVTDSLGLFAPEDAEGPFGFFESSDVTPSQIQRLVSEGDFLNSRTGFQVWLKSGPVEFAGPLTEFLLRQRGIDDGVRNYLKTFPHTERDRKRVAKLPFRSAWLAHFLHQIASPVIEENHRALDHGVAVPAFSRFGIRQASAEGLKRGLEACRAAGVTVREKSRVQDVRLAERAVDAIEVSDDRSGVERGRAFVWMLSSAETEAAAKISFPRLFPRGAIHPEWAWMRFALKMTGEAADDQLPPHAVLIEDPYLPWTHTNVLILRKRAQPKAYDLWLRLPSRVRAEPEYLKRMATEAEGLLRERMPQFRPVISGLPPETKKPQLACAMVPVFEPTTLARLQILKASNLFYCGPEQNETLDWLGRFRRQAEILSKLERLRAQWQAADRKREAQQQRRDGRSPNQGQNERDGSP